MGQFLAWLGCDRAGERHPCTVDELMVLRAQPAMRGHDPVIGRATPQILVVRSAPCVAGDGSDVQVWRYQMASRARRPLVAGSR